MYDSFIDGKIVMEIVHLYVYIIYCSEIIWECNLMECRKPLGKFKWTIQNQYCGPVYRMWRKIYKRFLFVHILRIINLNSLSIKQFSLQFVGFN